MSTDARSTAQWLVSSCGLLAIITAVVVAAPQHHGGALHDSPNARAARPAAANPIVIDPDVAETFTPSTAPPAAATVLTVDQAITDAATHGATIDAAATVQTGYLTFPVGPGEPGKYLAHHVYSYAFSWTRCGPVLRPAPRPGSTPSETPPRPPLRCTQWVFVNATTGDVLDMTWT